MEELWNLLANIAPNTKAKIAIWISVVSIAISFINIVKYIEDRPVLKIEKEDKKAFLVNYGLRSARDVYFRDYKWRRIGNKESFIAPKDKIELPRNLFYTKNYPVHGMIDKTKLFLFNLKIIKFLRNLFNNIKTYGKSLFVCIYMSKLLKNVNNVAYSELEYIKIVGKDNLISIYAKKSYNKNEFLKKRFLNLNPNSFVLNNIDDLFGLQKNVSNDTMNSDLEYDWIILVNNKYIYNPNRMFFIKSVLCKIKSILRNNSAKDINFYIAQLNDIANTETPTQHQNKYVKNLWKEELKNNFVISFSDSSNGNYHFCLGKSIFCSNGFIIFANKKDVNNLKMGIPKSEILVVSSHDGRSIFLYRNVTTEFFFNQNDIEKLRKILKSTKL